MRARRSRSSGRDRRCCRCQTAIAARCSASTVRGTAENFSRAAWRRTWISLSSRRAKPSPREVRVAWPSMGLGEGARLSAITIGELDDVVADVGGPICDQAGETPPVIRKKRARCLLELRQISGHGRHEVIARIARLPLAVLVAAGAPRLFDKFPQRD